MVPVIVVGRGLAGLTTAMCLAKANVPVKVLFNSRDKNAATQAAHGICTIKGILESDTERFNSHLKGHRGFEAWLTGWEGYLNKKRPDGVWISGVREVFAGPNEFRAEFGRIYRKDFFGAKNVIFTSANCGQFVEAFYPGDFWIDPSYLINTYEDCCRKLGVCFEDFAVSRSSVERGHIDVFSEDGKIIKTRALIICAGFGTVPMLAGYDLSEERLYAVSGYTFRGRSNQTDGCFVKKTTGVAFKDGVSHFGSTSDKAIKMEDRSDSLRWRTPAEEEGLASLLFQDTFHALSKKYEAKKLSDVESRWGVRVRTNKRLPLVKLLHKTSNGGVWINFGYYKSGIILSWRLARDLAAEVEARITA